MRAFLLGYEVDQDVGAYLRNKTGDDRLSDMTVLFAHKDRPVDREKLINTFAERLDRRIQFS